MLERSERTTPSKFAQADPILPGLSAKRQRRNWLRRGKLGYNHQDAGTRYLRLIA
jgi:hypothetical protein